VVGLRVGTLTNNVSTRHARTRHLQIDCSLMCVAQYSICETQEDGPDGPPSPRDSTPFYFLSGAFMSAQAFVNWSLVQVLENSVL
jgi:hypothetical protein